MKKHRYMKMSQFICIDCGAELSLPRLHCGQRKSGHVKDIYCPICKKDSKFKEVKYNEFYKTMAGDVIIK